jgi:glycosyltransferase involved in cell wall biosynthesis
MRVLLVNDWTETGGGVERHVLDVAAGLRGLGDEVRILAADVGAARDLADDLVTTSDRRAVQAVLQVVNPFAVRKAREVVRSFRPDVALVSMFEMRLSPAVLTALRPVPTVLSIGYYKPICPTGLKLLPGGERCAMHAGKVCVSEGCVTWAHWARDRPRYALIARELRRVAAIVTCSEHMRALLLREGVSALHHPWPTRRPAPGFVRAPAPEPLLVYVGRLAREKGVVELVHAFARVAPVVEGARLEIYGDGPARPAVEEALAANGLGGRVALHGWVDRDRLDTGLRRAWAAVVPSVWDEPLGLAAVEAIVRGVPVVATGSGGLREVVDQGATGILVPPGDGRALASALLDIATGTAFPDHRVDREAADGLAARHDFEGHSAWLRSILLSVA